MRQRVIRQRVPIALLIAVLAVAAALGIAGVTAQESDRPDATTAAVGTAFTYQGRQ